MFTDCESLVGGAGTVYDAVHSDYTYAHIDGGTSNPGYFTVKNSTDLNGGDFFTTETIEGVTLLFQVDNPDLKTCYVRGKEDRVPYIDIETTGTITIPSVARDYTVIGIGRGAFFGCSKVTEFVLPGTLETIDVEVFNYCSSITSLHIPASLKTIHTNPHPWSGCSSLTSITVDPQNPVYDSRNNCNAIIHTAENMLIVGCKTTTIPDDIVTIGYSSFDNMGELPPLVIPASVREIEAYAFWGCTYPSVTSYIEEPFETSCIWDHLSDGCILYVPVGKIEAYKALSEWNNFTKIFEIGSSPEPIVVSLVNNGDMEGDDVSSYFVKIHAGETVPATISNGVGFNESRGIKVEATAMEAEAWDNQFWFRLNQPVSEGTKFRVSYDYRADKGGTIQTDAHEEPGTFISMTIHGDSYDDVRYFSTEWQRFTYEGTMSSGNSSDQHPMQSVAFSLNHIEEANNYYFDNIVFDVYLEDQCPKPTFKQTDNSVIIQSPFDATIYFTLDGSTPTTNSEHANGAIALNLSRSTTIKAIAIVDGYEVSPVATYAFEPTEDNLDQRREELKDMIYWLSAEVGECRQRPSG